MPTWIVVLFLTFAFLSGWRGTRLYKPSRTTCIEKVAQGNHIETAYEKAALTKIRFKEETTVKLKKLFSLQCFGWLEILAMTCVSHSSGGCSVPARIVMLALVWVQCWNGSCLSGQLLVYALSFASWCLVPSHMLPSVQVPLMNSLCTTTYCNVISVTHTKRISSGLQTHGINYSMAFC